MARPRPSDQRFSPAAAAATHPFSGRFEPADEEFVIEHTYPAYMIPDLFTVAPPVRDALVTATSRAQDKTVDICLPFLSGEDDVFKYNEHGVPRLNKTNHIKFLHRSLEPLPGGFILMDASRPWFLYWSLSAMTMLGEDVSVYKDAIIETVRSMQNETGGFGGGGGQLSHLATTYAVVLALALVGAEEGFEIVDRKAMWRWICSLKQPDGGFQVGVGGEEDIRGAYCAAVIVTLLNLPLDLTPESPAWTAGSDKNLFSGLAEYVKRCQTFEGGISGQPNAEAHGAYAFCALGCLSILGDPRRIIPRYLDVPRLISWLSSRQYAPEGGFSGRTNKLVDGCYSHWVGGCFPLIEACFNTPSNKQAGMKSDSASPKKLPPASESLFSREGLIRYILCCCQEPSRKGGLRDKPGKAADAYHSCYVLSGLSSAQHQWELTSSVEGDLTGGQMDSVWNVLPYLEDDVQIFDHGDRVLPIHPVYAIPLQHQQAIRSYFLAKEGF
ncbi:terpenoid cyclases/protein prenyltransferase alpha-alpha toroid [Podospora didyma]|uniref:Protein farnesyltransferase subunit beta n=1 Tax=Podospora didyma TaxID=330526 RepID=A0AAE0NH27_9PEZI|nr:terpenoid cyclases/protein prenyltransferase alpha-alpha toroid [Podospora didyma]